MRVSNYPWLDCCLSRWAACRRHTPPRSPLYHPPPGGGIAALRRTAYDVEQWRYGKWVTTSATRLHEHASSIKLVRLGCSSPRVGGVAVVLRPLLLRLLHIRITCLRYPTPLIHVCPFCLSQAISCVVWLLELLQLSYFSARAAFPPTMSLWRNIATALVTLNISSMDGVHSFGPAFITAIILAMLCFAIVTLQVWGLMLAVVARRLLPLFSQQKSVED